MHCFSVGALKVLVCSGVWLLLSVGGGGLWCSSVCLEPVGRVAEHDHSHFVIHQTVMTDMVQIGLLLSITQNIFLKQTCL
jgi:hypothetical protein